MRRLMIMTAVAACAGSAIWSGAASAQGVELYVGPPAAYGYYNNDDYYHLGYSYGPRVYGYYNDGPSGRGYYRDPDNYRSGSKRWWQQMDRNGRGGHQN